MSEESCFNCNFEYFVRGMMSCIVMDGSPMWMKRNVENRRMNNKFKI